jgi:hypothetical protein
MDIASRVNYEFLYPLELRDPDTDEPLGIVFQIRSSGSDAASPPISPHGIGGHTTGKAPSPRSR